MERPVTTTRIKRAFDDREAQMQTLLMSAADGGNRGRERPQQPPRRATVPAGRADRAGSSAVPPAEAERPKSLIGRLLEFITRPGEANFDNP